jgi:hypothetical protein
MKSNKIPDAKSPDPQPTPQAPKAWNMQDGNKAHQGHIPHAGERYQGDVGDNPRYNYKDDGGTSGTVARRNDSSTGIGADATPSPGMDYFPAGSQPAPDRTSHRRVAKGDYQQGAGTPPATWLLGSSTVPDADKADAD